MRRVISKTIHAIGFLGCFLWELVLANLRMARDVVRPLRDLRPAIVAIPLDVKTDASITLFSNLLTLTPGTMSLDVSSDRKVLYIHAMNVRDVGKLRAGVKAGLERKVRNLLE